MDKKKKIRWEPVEPKMKTIILGAAAAAQSAVQMKRVAVRGWSSCHSEEGPLDAAGF